MSDMLFFLFRFMLLVLVRMCHCLVVLSGLPGAGKTFLVSRFISEQPSKTLLPIHVAYDKILPTETEKYVVYQEKQSSTSLKLWKRCRKCILTSIDHVIKVINQHIGSGRCLRDIDGQLMRRDSCSDEIYGNVLYDIETRFIQCVLKALNYSDNETDLVWFIDDNMYYRSMRYEYYKLARKNSLGFSQVSVKCPVELCMQRNLTRYNSVAEDIITAMNEKFETCAEVWENNSLCISSNDSRAICKLNKLIQKLLNDPLHPVPDDNENINKAIAQETSLKNVIHQSDLIVRHIVSERIKLTTNQTCIKEVARQANHCRSRIMDGLRSGKIVITTDIHQDVQCCDTSTLFVFLNKMFEKIYRE